jgi:hypothetical protein
MNDDELKELLYEEFKAPDHISSLCYEYTLHDETGDLLIDAVENEDINLIRELLKHNEYASSFAATYLFQSQPHILFEHLDTDTILLLLYKFSPQINDFANVLKAAVENNNQECADYIFNIGKNTMSDLELTEIMETTNNESILRLFVMDFIDAKDEYMIENALLSAIFSDWIDTVQIIFELYPQLDDIQMFLNHAILNDSINVLIYMLNNPQLNETIDIDNAFLFAAMEGKFKSAKYILNHFVISYSVLQQGLRSNNPAIVNLINNKV